MSKAPCVKCGGQRVVANTNDLCSRCWARLPRELRDDIRRAYYRKDHAECERLLRWAYGQVEP